MRKSNLISTVLAIALCTLTASAGMMGLGGLGGKKSSVLADLPGVHVKVVLRGSKELEKYNLTLTEQLRTKVESILRRRHIRLLSEDELPSVQGKPILELRINLIIDKKLSVSLMAINLRLLTHATAEEVYAQTTKVIDVLGQSGGYVVSASHLVQGDTPPENVVAMIRAAQTYRWA